MRRTFTIFALFYFVFESKFQRYKPGRSYSEGRFNGWFFAFDFGGLIFGWAYTCRGLFSEFYGKFCFVAQDI